MTKVSILIPVYNVRDYILKCLISVSNQSYSGKIECIIVDDCGSDDSMKIVDQFISNYKGPIDFKVIHHKQNRGLAAARNTGVARATGEFVSHLDSDDWLEPSAVELLVSKQVETNADIVSGNALAHYNNFTLEMPEPDYSGPLDMVHSTIRLTMDHVIWRRLIRRSLYTENGIRAIEGVNIGEDHHTLPRLVYFAKIIAKVDSIVYNYNCMNPTSYMRFESHKFNRAKYLNDTQSITILSDFFREIDGGILEELSEIEHKYKKNSRNSAISIGDKDSYIFLCDNQQITPKYLQESIKFRIRRLLSFFVHKILKL